MVVLSAAGIVVLLFGDCPASKSRHKKTAIETVNPPAKMMKAALGKKKKKARKSSS